MYAKTKLFHLELYANTLHFDIYTVHSDVEFGVKPCLRGKGSSCIPEQKSCLTLYTFSSSMVVAVRLVQDK